ncbi:MAG: polysaccharide deacetylase, partial [Planctomycetota bacterium]|nr:polysaccharide deacetylase [Planctomycetota bacterium]
MSNQPGAPVFFDPSQRRWPRVKRAFLILAIPVVLLLIFVLCGVLVNPILPSLGLPSALEPVGEKSLRPEALPAPPPSAPAPGTLSPRLRAVEERQKRLLAEKAVRTPPKSRLTKPAPEQEPIRAAFLVNWDEKSLASLKENHEHLDVVFAEWLHLTEAEAKLQEDDPARQRD